MRTYSATARNGSGLRFSFTFEAYNWNGIQDVADCKLAEVVAADELHQKNGPWKATHIDVHSG